MHPEKITPLKPSDLPKLKFDNACSIGFMLRKDFFSREKFPNIQTFKEAFRDFLLNYYQKEIPHERMDPENCIKATLFYCLSVHPTVGEIAHLRKRKDRFRDILRRIFTNPFMSKKKHSS